MLSLQTSHFKTTPRRLDENRAIAVHELARLLDALDADSLSSLVAYARRLADEERGRR